MFKKIFSIVVFVCAASIVSAEVRFNELLINVPGGSDSGLEYFELLSTSGGSESLDGLTFIAIEGDLGFNDPANDPGRLDEALDLSGNSTGSNGFFLWAEDDLPLNPLPPVETEIARGNVNMENDNNTYLLVRGYDGTPLGNDLDTNDDGILDLFPWTEVVDVVGVSEGTDDPAEIGNVFNYAEQLGGTGFINTHLSGNFPPDGFTPDAILRPAGFDTWVGMDVEAPLPFTFSSNEITRPDGSVLNVADFTDNILTPGSENVTFVLSGSNNGDYNGDGFVDAADFTVWRDAVGDFVSPFSGADGDGSGQIDAPDYDHWVLNYGEAPGAAIATSVPEPSALMLAFLASFSIRFRHGS